MKEIIIAMMMWIHTATGYSIPEIPDINYLNTMELRSYAYGCELTPIPSSKHRTLCCKKRLGFGQSKSYSPIQR